jgi:hypothetical protein
MRYSITWSACRSTGGGNRQSESPRGLQIDDELELRGLLEGQIGASYVDRILKGARPGQSTTDAAGGRRGRREDAVVDDSFMRR